MIVPYTDKSPVFEPTSQTNNQLNLDRIESITEEAFAVIIDFIRRGRKEAKIVEFGSGSSSIRLALELRDAQILSIESDQRFLKRSGSLAEEFGIQANLKFMYSMLEFQTYGPGEILSYQVDDFADPESIDFVIIDGPPFFTLRGREACLYQIYAKLRPGGIVILDDYQREAEKIILRNWLEVYPESFSVEIKEVGHGLAVLRKQKSVEARWDSQAKINDSILVKDNYQKVRFALSHITEEDWLTWLEVRRLNRSEYINMLDQVRLAYGVSADQVEEVVKADEELDPEAGRKKREIHIHTCVILFGMAG